MKLSLTHNNEKRRYEVFFNGEVIGEFITAAVAERFMVGQSCSMIIRNKLDKK